jgi:hypothetical protein
MRVLHQKLHLQHHSHTGKVLHHKHTSYRSLAIVFTLAGVAMWGLGSLASATAQSLFNVTGTLATPVPSVAAIISTPSSGAIVTASPTVVAGNCPVVSPQVVVAIDVDGTRAGSSICDANNDFSVPVTLAPGAHKLVAHTFTITGGSGPDSDGLPITYSSEKPVAVNTHHSRVTLASSVKMTPKQTTMQSGTVIAATADTPFSYLGASKAITWAGSITGGTAPYHVIADWGDGSQDEYGVSAGHQALAHSYPNVQSRNLTLFIMDAAGNGLTEQFAVAAYSTLVSHSALLTTNTPAARRSSATTIGLYGLFVTALAVSAIFWVESKHAARSELQESVSSPSDGTS